jgi:hypothetical protein
MSGNLPEPNPAMIVLRPVDKGNSKPGRFNPGCPKNYS